MATFDNPAAADLWSSYQAYLKGLGVLNEEISTFAKRRLDLDMELSGRIAKCKDWSEVIELQQDWARKTSEDYLSETSKVVDLASSAAKEYWAPFHEAGANMTGKTEK